MREMLKERMLLAYLGGNLLSITGTWGQRVVIFWMAWEITGSSSSIGLLAALDLLPSVLAAPIAGMLADRRPALRLARDIQLLSILPPLVLLPFVWFGEVGMPALVALSLATGILNGFDHPLRLLLVGSIVAREQVSVAVASNSMMFNLGRMIGPVLGGWAVAGGRPEIVFLYNAVTYAIFAGVFVFLGRDARFARQQMAETVIDEDRGPVALLRQVLAKVGSLYILFAAMALLIRPLFELLPAFAAGVAHSGVDPAVTFSLMTSAQGLGAMGGAVAVAVLVRRIGLDRLALGMGVLSVAAVATFLGVLQLTPALAALAILSGAILANGIATQIAVHTRLDPRVRGRALALYTITFRGLPALGALGFGLLSDVMPIRLIFALSAAGVTVMLGLQSWSRSRRHR